MKRYSFNNEKIIFLGLILKNICIYYIYILKPIFDFIRVPVMEKEKTLEKHYWAFAFDKH
jgi:hypothetical protein